MKRNSQLVCQHLEYISRGFLEEETMFQYFCCIVTRLHNLYTTLKA